MPWSAPSLHGVFERTDFDAPRPGAGGGRRVWREELTWRNVDLGDRAHRRGRALCAAIESPLGPLADGVALRDMTRRDRLDELGFEIPLVGGDSPRRAALHLGAVADLLEAHLARGDPVARYAAGSATRRSSATLRGYLTGSLDLVFRLPRRPLRAGRLQDEPARRARARR